MAGYNGIQILRGSTSSIQNKELLDGQPLFVKDKNYLVIGRGDESKIPVSTRELKGYVGDDSGVTSSTDDEFHVLYDSSKSLLDIKSPADLNVVATSINITGSGGIDLNTSGALRFNGMTWQEDVSNKTVNAQAILATNVGTTVSLNVGNNLKFAIDSTSKKLSVTGDLNVTTSNINISTANVNFNASSGSNIRFDLGEYGAKLNIGKDITAVGSNINFTATGDVSLEEPAPTICLNTATLLLETPADTSTYAINSASDVSINANGTVATLGNSYSSQADANVGVSLTLPSRTISYKVGSISYHVNLPSWGYGTLATTKDIIHSYAHCLEIRCGTDDPWSWAGMANRGGDWKGGMLYTTLYLDSSRKLGSSTLGEAAPDAFLDALPASTYAPAVSGLWYNGVYNIVVAIWRTNSGTSNERIHLNVIPFNGVVSTLEFTRSEMKGYIKYILDDVYGG